MHALEHLEDVPKWEQPDSYGGFSPIGDYAVISRTRDSGCLETSNYYAALKCLEAVAEVFADPPDVPRDHVYYGRGEGNDASWVYTFSASHWGCGWVEYVMVRADAPEPILEEVAEIYCSLQEYPVLDDSDYSDRQYAAVMERWKGLPLRWRLNAWKEAHKNTGSRWRDSNYFVIRHDDAYLRDDHLFDRLKEGL